MTEQQALTYLYWLKDRGQTFVVPCEGLSSAETPIEVRVLFLSPGPLAENELEMLRRIASALGLSSTDYAIDSSVAAYSAKFLVKLGDGPLPSPSSRTETILTIPEPRAMLDNPSLKVSAWERLQTLKAKLS